MQIRFVRSGGFAGLTLSANIDPAELPPEDAQELLTTLQDSGILEEPPALESTPEPPTPAGYVDEMVYEVTIEVGDYEHTVNVTESEATPEMQELFSCLSHLARRSGRG